MRLSISNIAWDIGQDAEMAALLSSTSIDAIDIAPGKYFPEPGKATSQAIAAVGTWWRTRGIEIVGMQSLLFGTNGLNLFGPPESRSAMLRHLESVFRIAGELGASRLVFGSPRNRDRTGIEDEPAMARAVQFFHECGELAAAHDVTLCLEPNPERYGANFMISAAQTLQVVRATGHRNVRMQFDTGAITISGESPSELLREAADWIGHVHLSEPDLRPLGEGGTDHAAIASELKHAIPDHIAAIEMLPPPGGIDGIRHAISVAERYYADTRP